MPDDTPLSATSGPKAADPPAQDAIEDIESSGTVPAVPPPDVLEHDLDDIVPTRGYQLTPMVGLGGSAGAIPALREFFRNTPPDTGMIFVVVLHLSPEHTSTLPQILQADTKMPVVTPKHGEQVLPNHVYVIPPAKHLLVLDGHLSLPDLEPERGRRVAVDLFFRSMADTHGPHATAIVLSGADADGAIGIRRIKERGGLTIAQDPDEAEHSGMPRSAITTGMVDWVLPVQEMPARIVEYRAHENRLRLPAEEGPQPARILPTETDGDEAALREVLIFLRTRTGRDFSYYKRATIVRRISRRMQVNGLDDVQGYLSYMRMHPGEAGALLQDLLISVTNFFRDREAFAGLEREIPKLFEGKTATDAVRVWCPACATGEEAYSMAILLMEHARKLEVAPVLQVFGCDLDEQAIQVARAGIYPDTIEADVSEERLRRFFTREHGGYRVRREIREIVLFATHDLLKDAPFSRMDLISCRNLMIYLNREAQKRIVETFHFALRPGGRLFLGSSESIDDDSPLFTPIDKKHRIYQQRAAQRVGLPISAGPSTVLRALAAQEEARQGPVVHGRTFPRIPGVVLPAPPPEDRGSVAELHFKLLERFAPPSIVVNEQHEIVHLSESAGRYLHFSGGEPTVNLLRVVSQALRVDLRGALLRASETGQPAEAFGVPVEIEGSPEFVDLRVVPASELATGYFVVILQKREAVPAERVAARQEPDPIVEHLERELERVKRHLRDTVEQYEAGTEELKASNEELQAMNEELRSATEELETSREELQSINEELTTVNHELKSKVDELAHANSDLHNLMGSTSIATVFLDRDLRIKRYTPAAVSLFHFIPSDVGRPLGDLKFRIDYRELTADAEQVLGSLVPVEREVRDADGRCFLSRLLPYRTVEDRIAGVVLTFVDVTARKRAEDELTQRNIELERFNKAAVGRELRMVELKREVNELLAQLGKPARHSVEPDDPAQPPPSSP